MQSAAIADAYVHARDELLAARSAGGPWVGRLSNSALSTATAVSALAIVRRADEREGGEPIGRLVDGGVRWLLGHQNPDGGWGDTDRSPSNIATTMLVRAALCLAGGEAWYAEPLAAAAAYVQREGGIAGLRRRYGNDKTFAVPILTNAALAGLVPWQEVQPLPFELAALPHWLLPLVRLPVVSYAIPALVAIGQARYFHLRPRAPWTRLIRRAAVGPSLAAAERMQPASGGYLEATPLTSFVTMGLAGTGRADHPIVRRGVEFLAASVRDDGSWPIDTNLATWNTTLAIGALAAGGEDAAALQLADWLLGCQHQAPHPFTRAAPGGWGWSDLSGAVPDADDTAGALLALAAIRRTSPTAERSRLDGAAAAGVGWLLALQNRDGGWPTFCRGWGTLPFDRSGCDLTAHVLRAIDAWRGLLPAAAPPIARATAGGLSYLARMQQTDGRWLPLWFGNDAEPDESNPVYGTARVVAAYRDLGKTAEAAAVRGRSWLVANQHADGSWGGSASAGGSVEETALASETLLDAAGDDAAARAAGRGIQWLVAAVREGRHRRAAPIGLYFARLWYYEELYPLVFLVGALGRAVRLHQG